MGTKRILFWMHYYCDPRLDPVLNGLRELGYDAEQTTLLHVDPNRYDAVFAQVGLIDKMGEDKVRKIKVPLVVMDTCPDSDQAVRFMRGPNTLAEYYMRYTTAFSEYRKALEQIGLSD